MWAFMENNSDGTTSIRVQVQHAHFLKESTSLKTAELLSGEYQIQVVQREVFWIKEAVVPTLDVPSQLWAILTDAALSCFSLHVVA